MKGLLIYRVNFANTANYGVVIKGKGQAKAYRENDVDLDLIFLENKTILINDQAYTRLSGINTVDRNHRVFWKKLKELDLSSYDFIHIRYPYSTPWFFSFIKGINKKTKCLIEFPTYPYDSEFLGLKTALLKVDHYYRQKVISKADYIVHYGSEPALYGTSCINITNGVDLDQFPIRKPIKTDHTLRLVAVGKWQYWHGLDRMLYGISACPKLSILLHIIGVGPENQKLKRLTLKLGISNKVKFVGNKKGEELNHYFNNADLAIGTLGMHRKNVALDASLKHREYAARGVPFVLSTADRAFPGTCGFVHYVPADDSPVNMELVKNLLNIDVDENSIRAYANQHFSWNNIISKILDETF